MDAEKRGVVIEQLFEDIPTTAYSSNAPTSIHTTPGIIPQKLSVSTPSKQISSSFSLTTLQDKTPTRPKAAWSRNLYNADKTGFHGDTSDGRTKTNPMNFKIALALFNEKLTPWEKEEIVNFPSVFYFGANTTKKVTSDGTMSSSVFDDDENFYKFVPRDHIAYRYEVWDKPSLGKGTFGQVLKAYDHKEQKYVALKIVRNERIYLKQSREELRILQVLRKQDAKNIYNVIHINEFFMFRNHMCISFELLGMNLYQVLRRNNFRGLPSNQILSITKAVLKCLELLFKNRIIHCDIKPENIMLKRNGDFTSVKVGDFGSSCYEQQQVYHYIQSRYYRAPEVILGMRYGPAIDMWSLGCVLCELSTGSPVMVGDDEDDQLSAAEECLGEIPSHLLTKYQSKGKVRVRKKGRGSPGSRPLSSVIDGDDFFKDMVKKALEWDPLQRPNPTEIQEHPWLNHSMKHLRLFAANTSSSNSNKSKSGSNTNGNSSNSLKSKSKGVLTSGPGPGLCF